MHIDFFIPFASCEGMCLFCKRGKDIIEFERGEYVHDPNNYYFFQPKSEDEMFREIQTCASRNPETLAITGFEPVLYGRLEELLREIQKHLPAIKLTLRSSWISHIPSKIIEYFDRIELPLYGDAQVHNLMCGNERGWNMLHENLHTIRGIRPESLRLQTVVTAQNIAVIDTVFEYLDVIDYRFPFKVIYPHFMPRDSMRELMSRSEVIKQLLKSVPRDTLRSRCILGNFSKNPILEPYFLDIRP